MKRFQYQFEPSPKLDSKVRQREHPLALLVAVSVILIVFACNESFSSGMDDASRVLSPDTSSCEGPASTPACASKTWNDCFDYRNPALCAKVGRPDIVFWSTEVSEDGESVAYKKVPPRSEPIGSEEAPILGVAVVAPDRFDWVPNIMRDDFRKFGRYDPSAVPPELRGTHEVKYGWLVNGRVFDAYSQFFRKEANRWVLTSWTWHFNEQCYRMRVDYHPQCKYFIYPVPWDKWYDE